MIYLDLYLPFHCFLWVPLILYFFFFFPSFELAKYFMSLYFLLYYVYFHYYLMVTLEIEMHSGLIIL